MKGGGFFRRALERVLPRVRASVDEAVRDIAAGTRYQDAGIDPTPAPKVGFGAMTREQHRDASRKGALAGHARRKAEASKGNA